MPPSRHSSRIDVFEIKACIVRKIGHEKAEKYFHYLQTFLSLKIRKCEFNRLCLSTIGRENVGLHNRFIVSILKNAALSKTAPIFVTKEAGSSNAKSTNGYQRNLQSLCGDAFPPSTRRSRSTGIRDCKFRDHPSPLGPNGKIQGHVYDESISGLTENAHKLSSSGDLKGPREQRSALDIISIGSKALVEVASVEDGEEVEQAACSPCIQSRSPVRPPFGIPVCAGVARKALRNGSVAPFHLTKSDFPETCSTSSVLPDSKALRKRLEQRLEVEGLKVSVDCANLLNNALDAFLKRLIKPCMELAQARCGHESMTVNCKAVHGMNSAMLGKYVQKPNHCFSGSLLDFQVAMELNPQLLGEDWPVHLEKICLQSLGE
eukprot:TRINITY_DN4160_c0_g2_i3.p1 TRINITY_DN4160_c0_g2~~TRINITY_DN4160_c0_g2_i3.p1  ORF type:complete len:376 (-),score=74.92 TRINITY_DN4160_c0_g2_i3:592-1719(-)